jgi:hypothetical protein
VALNEIPSSGEPKPHALDDEILRDVDQPLGFRAFGGGQCLSWEVISVTRQGTVVTCKGINVK